MFGPLLEYRVGRCRDCGYWARFEHAFGSEGGHLHCKGEVEAFGEEVEQVIEIQVVR
jgi:hypothetical protein